MRRPVSTWAEGGQTFVRRGMVIVSTRTQAYARMAGAAEVRQGSGETLALGAMGAVPGRGPLPEEAVGPAQSFSTRGSLIMRLALRLPHTEAATERASGRSPEGPGASPGPATIPALWGDAPDRISWADVMLGTLACAVMAAAWVIGG